MNDVPGYTLTESLREEANEFMARGTRNSDGAPVLVIASALDRQGTVLARLEHEYSLRSELDPAWAARPIALIRDDGNRRAILVLEDPGGHPLHRLTGQRLPLDRFLPIAIGLARSLGGVHAAGLIHKDIRPAVALFDDASESVHLVGFGLVSRLPREHQRPEPPGVIAGTLAYIAPEQTGRMNRSVDSRSDLYSLGVSLYELLSGSLPFNASDPIEWVHCHIARRPAPLVEVLPSIPSVLSEIVMKLLAKAAEDRYQTTAGIEADLRRCLDSLRSKGRIEPFAIGEQDGSDRLSIPEKLYGREAEVAELVAAFDRVAAMGRPELVLVSGYAGVGKSSLVHELQRAVVAPRGFFVAGKFDQYKRDIPYDTLAQAFRTLLRQILGQSDAAVDAWRVGLRAAVGSSGQLLVDLMPELELIIGPQPPTPALPLAEARNRFDRVFRAFLGAFATADHPLVVFLDDLQWADTASLHVLGDVFSQRDARHLLVVGAFRDDEVPQSHPLALSVADIGASGAAISEIVVRPLSAEDLARLVADALRCTYDEARPLARLIHGKTLGNPFFAIQFLRTLSEGRLVRFDGETRSWTWDLDAIRAQGFTENVIDLMVRRLGRLSAPTRAALQLAAAIGNEFDSRTLAVITGKSAAETEDELFEALREELLTVSGSRYQFLHDRIQQAAYSAIPVDRRSGVHLRIGRLLMSQTPADQLDQRLFEIVNQVNQGSALLDDQDERDRIAWANLAAGMKARDSAAYRSAAHYLATGAELLPQDAWESRPELAYQIHLEWARCEFVDREFERAAELLEKLFSHVASPIERAAVYQVKIELEVSKGELAEAVDTALECLAMLGIDVLRNPSKDDAVAATTRTLEGLGDRSIEDLLDLPAMLDPVARAALSTLIVALPPAYFLAPNLHDILSAEIVALSVRHGNADGSAMGYGTFGAQVGALLGEHAIGFRFGELSRQLLDRQGLTAIKGKVLGVIAAFIYAWRRPFREVFELFIEGFEACVEAGDLTFACYMASNIVWFRAAIGDPLGDVAAEADRRIDFTLRARFEGIADTIRCSQGFVTALAGRGASMASAAGPRPTFDDLEPQMKVSPLPINRFAFHMYRTAAGVFMHDQPGATQAALEGMEYFDAGNGQMLQAEYTFYAGLALAASYGSAAPDQQAVYSGLLRQHLARLADWAARGPANHGHHHDMLAAEIARIEGRELEAERFYEQAIRAARANGFVHQEALAHELAARFYFARGFETIGNAYLTEARAGYSRWGAEAKLEQLDERYPQLRAASGLGPPTTLAVSTAELDLMTVVKVSQAVSGEILTHDLVQTLLGLALEHAGAGRGLLILARDGQEPQVEAEAIAGPDRPNIRLQRSPVRPLDLPVAVVQYSLRTREPVILDDAAAGTAFREDDYLRQAGARSILCLPLVKQATLVGALYLENNLAPNVFTPNRIALLELIASQAAISLENARLFGELQTENRERALAEEAFAQSRLLVTAVTEGTADAIFVKDLEGRYLMTNTAGSAMIGRGRDDVVGRTDDELFPPEVALAMRTDDAAAMARGSVTGERVIPTSNGDRTFFLRKDVYRDPDGRAVGVVGIARDVTERVRLEAELRQSQKMEAIGRLAGGVAHDFNNLLTAITGYADLIRASVATDDPLRSDVEQILSAAASATDLTRSLLSFARRGHVEPRVISITGLARDLEMLLRRLIGENVKLVLRVAPDLWPVRADPSELQQVLVNLAVNARDAMPDGGVLLIETRNVVVDEDEASGHPNRDSGEYVLLSVTDSGVGIDEEARAHLFEPFFTTKERGKGTGLGLATTYGIVSQAVESARGSGTTFRVFLPRVYDQLVAEEEPEAPDAPLGHETILLVEDDALVRGIARRILVEQGYRVLEAADGTEALEIAAVAGDQIQLLITDLLMPGMRGTELAARLGAVHPSLRVLYTSGYAADAFGTDAGGIEPGIDFLPKPFGPTVLSRRVREALDQPPGTSVARAS